MFKDGKVFGKFNVIDFSICVILLVLICGIFLVKVGIFRPITKIATGVKPVQFTIVTKAYDVTAAEELFHIGDKTFITIRNVPYTSLEIVNVNKESAKEMFFNYDRPELPYLIKNVAYPNRVQYEITVKDEAQITADGPVIGGNKIKIGLPVDIEGFNYRFGGMVSDVQVIEKAEEE